MEQAWLLKATGELLRPYIEGEVIEGFSAATHEVVDVPPEVWNGSKAWDPETRAPVGVAPESVTPLQLRKAFRATNRMSALKGYIASLPEDVRDEWEYGISFTPDNPAVASAATFLGMSAGELRALFILAGTL